MIITRNDTKRKKYFGIAAEAKRLGVSTVHLWLVLEGRRQSKRIMNRVRIGRAS